MGDYKIIGELIEAKVKVAFAWGEITEYLPQSQPMGSLEYIAPEPTPTPALTSTPAPTPSSLEYGIAWWVWLIVAIAVATTVVNIIWFLRHRATYGK